MSKTKHKRARREAKREHQKKVTKAAHTSRRASTTQSQPVAKKQKINHANTNSVANPKANSEAQTAPGAVVNLNGKVQTHSQASQKHPIPFDVYDKVLLVGEGDFSFARSLCVEHGCANVTATSFDSEEEVREKYPTFSAIEQELISLTPPVPMHHSIDATKLSTYKPLTTTRADESEDGDQWQPYDTIAFMFPHTGGLSTDVNRQVRANQNLIVSFFRSCLQLSSYTSASASSSTSSGSSAKRKRKDKEFLKTGGKIIVTLFESEPYTLWNIRDLARHVGLKVVESFKFDSGDYPGYKHVRTLGHIEGGGAWKAEDRSARMYVFEKVEREPEDGEDKDGSVKTKKGKRKDANGRGKKRERDGSGSGSGED